MCPPYSFYSATSRDIGLPSGSIPLLASSTSTRIIGNLLLGCLINLHLQIDTNMKKEKDAKGGEQGDPYSIDFDGKHTKNCE